MKNHLFKKEFSYDTKDKVIMNIDFHPKYNLFACGAESFCQTYSISHHRIDLLQECQSDFSKDEDDRLQKRVKFIPDISKEGTDNDKENKETSHIITCGVDGFLRIWNFPKLKMIKEVKVHDQEIIDLDVTRNFVVVTTKKLVKIFSLKRLSKDDNIDFNIEHIKTFSSQDKYNYRDSVFSKDEKQLFITEYLPQKSSHIQIFDTSDWHLIKSKQINLKGEHHTMFTIHPSKDLLALGTSEGSLYIYETNSMKNIMKCKPHNFIITGLRFYDYIGPNNQKNCSILSCSADNTVVSTKITIKKGRYWMIILIVLIIFISILIEIYRKDLIVLLDNWKQKIM